MCGWGCVRWRVVAGGLVWWRCGLLEGLWADVGGGGASGQLGRWWVVMGGSVLLCGLAGVVVLFVDGRRSAVGGQWPVGCSPFGRWSAGGVRCAVVGGRLVVGGVMRGCGVAVRRC